MRGVMNLMKVFGAVLLVYLLPISRSFRTTRLGGPPYDIKSRMFATSGDVPSDYFGIERLMQQSLQESILNADSNKLSIDLLTPGLNPKLEQRAMLQQEFLFDLSLACLQVVQAQYGTIHLAFQSAGDAAGFQKHCSRSGVRIPTNVVLTDVNERNLRSGEGSGQVDCVLYIAAKNNVGDPVIKEIQKSCVNHPDIQYFFVNCDLEDKVATGMSDRSVRESFRSSILPAFYFRNVVTIIRPSLVPIEIGAVLYTYQTKWGCYLVNEDEIYGPGSLNRFMKQAVYQRHPRDPSKISPPQFIKIGNFDTTPSRNDLQNVFARAGSFKGKFKKSSLSDNLSNKENSIGQKEVTDDDIRTENLKIDDVITAEKVLNYTVKGYVNAKVENVLKACLFLENHSSANSSNCALGMQDAQGPQSRAGQIKSVASDAEQLIEGEEATAVKEEFKRYGLLDLSVDEDEQKITTTTSSKVSKKPTKSRSSVKQTASDGSLKLRLVLEIVLDDVYTYDSDDISEAVKETKISYCNDSPLGFTSSLLFMNQATSEGIAQTFVREVRRFGLQTEQYEGKFSTEGSIVNLEVSRQTFWNFISRPPITKKDQKSIEKILYRNEEFYLLKSRVDEDSLQSIYRVYAIQSQ